jgi:hypothetical protein
VSIVESSNPSNIGSAPVDSGGQHPFFADQQTKTDREIPIVELRRREG